MDSYVSRDPLARENGRNVARTQDAFGALADDLPRDPLAGPSPRERRRSPRDTGAEPLRDNLGVLDRSLGPTDLLKRPDNRLCADCEAPEPKWASVNIGIFICDVCAGTHRGLGAHISVVKSVALDKWKPQWIENCRSIGNATAKAFYEHSVPPQARPSTGVGLAGGDRDKILSQWIRAKYDFKEFAPPGVIEPWKRIEQGERNDIGPLGVLQNVRDDRVQAVPTTVEEFVVALDEEERELWRQLRRKSEFEMRVAEKRAQLAELRDRRRGVSTACADAAASIENLTGQVDFARMHEREIEHDIAVLRESNRIMQSAFQAKNLQKEEAVAEMKSGHLPHHLTESERLAMRQQARERANVIESKREQEAVLEYEQITHLRAHLERLCAEKASLQQRQQMLLEKQHASEQDRNLLLSSLQEERKGINDLRHERLRLWEERHGMEREMTNIVQEAHFRVLKDRTPDKYRAGVDPSVIAAQENAHMADPFAQDAMAGRSILSGGVRVPATLDTPVAFASNAGELFSAGRDRYGADVRKEPSTRKNWTSFAGDAVQRGGGGVVDSGGAGFGLSGVDSGANPGGGITEWAGRLQDYRTAGSSAR